MPRQATWARLAAEPGANWWPAHRELGWNQAGCPACLFLVMMSLQQTRARATTYGFGRCRHLASSNLETTHTPLKQTAGTVQAPSSMGCAHSHCSALLSPTGLWHSLDLNQSLQQLSLPVLEHHQARAKAHSHSPVGGLVRQLLSLLGIQSPSLHASQRPQWVNNPACCCDGRPPGSVQTLSAKQRLHLLAPLHPTRSS